jgi:CheY-like chemotaxis protein
MILIVDDQPDISCALAMLLAHYGYEVSVADRGRDALRRMAERPPHCVILDYNMPEMDGLEVLRLIRADPRYDRVHVILFTACDEAGLRSAALAGGADAFVTKGSLDFAELERAVRRHCSPTRPPRPAVDPPRRGVG